MTTLTKSVKMGVATLAIMNVTAVVSLRGLPAEAEYGISSAFYYLFAALVFLIPTSFVAAELAAMFQDKQGGVFRWVGEAFGKRMGFVAIWLQWVESTIWYPTVLTFGAVSLAFIGMNDNADMSLASNKLYTLVVVLAIYWAATYISLKGLGWVSKVAKVGGLVGTIIPAALLVLLGIIYLIGGGKSQMDFGGDFFPDITKLDNLVLASGIFLFYAGMEMTGIHVKDMENPSKNYPKAVFMGAIITVLIFVLGTFALGIIIPQQDINLTQSLLVGFDNYFAFVGASWLSPIIAIALAFGVLAGVLTWVSGPSKGIFAVGKAGYLPPFMQRANKIGVQKNILLIQGGVVTILSLLFVVMPSVQSFYQILSQLTVLLYLIMYLLMFAAAPLFPAIYNTTDEVRHLATRLLIIVALAGPIQSISHSAYSAFQSGLAVCDGYTAAYNLLLKLEGIDCSTMSTADNSHIWTVAELDGVSYHIDPTWGDQTGSIRYEYFNMTEEKALACF